ncbi:putative ribonuclease H-like domain-containing protein [Tanacetum coccineum]|uniref:Ribonuclease H-like domain-containing protein n=1 Tax=Tanacetum coccineum TaxID=301880 RepID=A0ABQ4YK78_9ASTR
MTRNMSYLTKFEEIDGGYVAFGGNPKGGKITGRVPRKNNMYSVDLKNIVPKGGLTCLFAKATSDESKLWHRRLGHINFKTMNKLVKGNLVRGSGSNWLFDIDALTKSMNYKPVVVGNLSNGNVGTKACDDAGKAKIGTIPGKYYILLSLWPADSLFSQSSKSSPDAGFKPLSDGEQKFDGNPSKEDERDDQEKDDNVNNTNNVNTVSDGNNTNNVNAVSSTVTAAGIEVNAVGAKTSIELPDDPNMSELEDIVYSDDDKDVGAEADMNNLDAFMAVRPILTTRVHKDHPVEQIIGDLNSAPQTRRMTKNLEEHEPKKVIHALKDPSWIEAMQDELLQFKLQKVWTLVDLPNGKRAIGTKWVYKNKKDERGVVIKNKARLVVQGYTQEEGIDYDEVFAPFAIIEAIRLFLAYALFKDFVVYQMDVKSAFLYGNIEEEVYVCQIPGFEDPDFPDRVYKVEKALYGLHQAPKAWYETLSTYLLDNGLQREKIDKILFIIKDKGDILLVQVYVDDIIFGSTKRSLCTEFEKMMHKKFQMSSMGELTFFLGLQTTSTPMETQKAMLKDEDGEEVDVHLYRSVIGSLMYLTSSRLDIIGYSVYMCTDSKFNQKFQIFMLMKKEFLVTYRDSNKKKLIQMIKIHTNKNVTDLLTKAFDMKTVNGEVQLQALVDGKKIIIIEATIRRDLQLEDAEVFAMDSAIICLATNQKFNFSKYIFESMVKNLDNAGKFLMYPRFIQVFLDNQLEGMATHTRTYIAPSHTKKIFANMRRQGKDFSGRVTPLFPTMVVQAQEEMGEGSAMPMFQSPHQTFTQLHHSQPQKKQKSRRPKRKNTKIPQSSVPSDPTNVADEAVNEEPSMQLKELINFCTKLQQRVLDLENTKTAQAKDITSLKLRVKWLRKKGGVLNDEEVFAGQDMAEKEVSTADPNKDQISFDEQEAIRLQAEFDEEDKLAREKAQQVEEANITWDDIQAKIDAVYQLTERLQAQETT